MAIAAQEAFRMADKPVFYVSVESDELLWIDTTKPTHQLTKPLSLKSYFAIHGYTIQPNDTPIPEKWMAFGGELVRNAPKWAKSLASLNYYAHTAAEKGVLDIATTPPYPAHWDEMLEQLWGNEIIRSRDHLNFRSPYARTFANGGWFEQHIFHCVKQFAGVHNPQANLIIQNESDNKNELDVTFLKKNRLFIIECKTKSFNRNPNSYDNSASDAIYKLNYLRRSGGLRTKSMLISFRLIRDEHKSRAEESDITVIDQSGLPRLQELLKSAIK